jgi:hypothetical protein
LIRAGLRRMFAAYVPPAGVAKDGSTKKHEEPEDRLFRANSFLRVLRVLRVLCDSIVLRLDPVMLGFVKTSPSNPSR